MNLSLIGKTALIGGASAGIGRAIALELAALGANTVLLARTAAALESAIAELDTASGQRHRYITVDFSDQAALAASVHSLLAQTPIDILINNTGGPPGGPIADATPEAFLQAYHNHLLCNHLLAQAVLPGMKTRGFGRIINIISTSVKEPLEGLGVSNTTRWAVASWAKTLAGEVAKFGITVNNVLPGFTETGRLQEIIQKKAASTGLPEEQIIAQMRAQTPAQRFALPAEVAAAAAFLATPAAAYINGINLPVDGGRTKSL